MLPSRPSNSGTPSPVPRKPNFGAPPFSFDTIKKRIVAKLEDRIDLSASKRIPQSILRQTLRQQAEQLAELEGRSLAKGDRERLIDEIIIELFGYGPLDELFADATVREVMVTAPDKVIARHENAQWLPTSVKFRDESHVRAVLDKIASHADAVGPVMTSVGTFDMKLPNGFRVLAVIPPEALSQPATVAFVREVLPATPKETLAASASPVGSASNGVLKTVSGTTTTSPRQPESGSISNPPQTPSIDPSPSGANLNDPLARYRARILEQLLLKFARLRLYDVQKLDPHELQKIIAAYISEYAETERIYLSDPDHGRLTLEILTALRK